MDWTTQMFREPGASRASQVDAAFIRSRHKSKVAIRDIVAELNDRKRTRRVPWTVSAATWVIKNPPAESKIDMVPFLAGWNPNGFTDDKGNPEEEYMSEEDAKGLAERIRISADDSWEKLEMHFSDTKADDGQPVDWAKCDPLDRLCPRDQYAVEQYRKGVGLSGKDTWFKSVLPIFIEQTENTGKNILKLMSRITGFPAERAQIKRLILGVYAALARTRETNAALRLEIADLKAKLADHQKGKAG